MKEIIAILRPNMVAKTVKALEAVGFPALSVTKCTGRGKQKGYVSANMPDSFDLEKVIKEGEAEGRMIKNIPKRLLSIVADDLDYTLIVNIIMKVNRSGRFGDGRIFIIPTENAIQIRTGDVGTSAIGN
ncbi:MAG: P-II family nitrogen regulator [Methanosarcinaceae archaeon]|jgi:nitrogen regulatory protein PII 2|nr:P-II family nitrogen regulator [Methanosarcinaceae archaeon]NKQ38325.1 P-II family nitrogen regulator [Methanosarcinales archaeon]